MKTAVLAVVGVATLYLFGAFIEWDFNAGDWQEGGRGLVAGMALVWIVFCGIVMDDL
jgi:hypothetical protein